MVFTVFNMLDITTDNYTKVLNRSSIAGAVLQSAKLDHSNNKKKIKKKPADSDGKTVPVNIKLTVENKTKK